MVLVVLRLLILICELILVLMVLLRLLELREILMILEVSCFLLVVSLNVSLRISEDLLVLVLQLRSLVVHELLLLLLLLLTEISLMLVHVMGLWRILLVQFLYFLRRLHSFIVFVSLVLRDITLRLRASDIILNLFLHLVWIIS